jgi:hypothetical protein
MVVTERVISSREEDDDEDREPDRERQSVGADEAVLGLAELTRAETEPACQLSDRATDQRPLDKPREEVAERDGGPVEDRVVELVPVELVLEDRQRLRDGQRLRRVEQPGEPDPGEPGDDRARRSHELVAVGCDRERRCDLGEPVGKRVPLRRELEEAADGREDGEHADCPDHREGAFLAVVIMEVLLRE